MPTAAHDVIIQSDFDVTIQGCISAEVKSVTINTGAEVIIDDSNTLSINDTTASKLAAIRSFRTHRWISATASLREIALWIL